MSFDVTIRNMKNYHWVEYRFDHCKKGEVYSLSNQFFEGGFKNLMDLVDNDPNDNDRVMSKIFATAYARYLLHTTLMLLPVKGYKFNTNDIFHCADLMYAFKTSSPTFLNTARERR